MKLLRVSFLKTFRHMLRNKVWEASGLLTDKLMIRGFASDKSVEPNLVSFNAVIEGLLSEGRMEEAQKVLEEMNRKGLAIDETTYNTLISGMSKLYRAAPAAVKLYDEMRVKGFSLNEKNYNSLIHLLCWHGKFLERGYNILADMIHTGFSPSVDSYHSLIESYCFDERVDEALEIFRGMIQRGVSPIADIYKSLLEVLCLKQPRLSQAFHLFRDMLRRGVLPDEGTYFTLLNAYCLEAEFTKAFHMHHEMLHKGFLPDFDTAFSPSLVTCNALIHGLCFLGRAEEALEILRGMPEMGLSPDAVSYTTVIFGFCRNREPRKAYELKLEMDEKTIWWLDEDMISTIMQGLSDEDTYSSLMNDYFVQGNLEKASKLEDEMRRHGSLPTSVTVNVLFNGLIKKGRTREAKEDLLWNISEYLGMPAEITYDTLIENCTNNEFKSVVGLVKGFITRDLVNEAARAHDTMLEGNYKPDGAVYNSLIFHHSRSRNVHKAYDMYMEMVHYGFVPHMFSVLALIKALHRDGRYNEMRWVIQNTLRSCNLNDSELLKVLNEIDIRKCEIYALRHVLAEVAMDGLLLDGGKCS